MTLRSLAPLALLLAAGCGCHGDGSNDSTPPPPETTLCPTDLTWDNFGKGFVETWCSACHSESVEGDWRQCSPLPENGGLNFDTLEEVQAAAALMDRKVWGDVAGPPPVDGTCNGVPTVPDCTCLSQSDMQMPPAGGMSQADRDLFHEWASCGAPGEPTVLDACDPLNDVPSSGSVTIASQADADAFCAAGTNHVAGDLTITGGAVSMDCLCSVDGTVEIDAGATEASFASLAIAGALLADGATSLTSLSAPKLETLSLGDLTVRGDDALAMVDLTLLTYVTLGSVTFEDLPALVDLPLPELAEVGGDFTFRNVDATTTNLVTLHKVLGNLTLTDNPYLMDDNPYPQAGDLPALVEVDGAIDISRNLALPTLVNMAKYLIVIGGPVTIVDNPSLTTIDGFDTYGEYHPDDPEVTLPVLFPIDVTISGNAALNSISVFKALQSANTVTIDGNATLAAIGDQSFANTLWTEGAVTITNNPALSYMLGFGQLDHSGDLHLDGNSLDQSAPWFDLLTAVHGDLSISGNTGLADINGLDLVATVDGDLTIDGNPLLASISGPQALATVGGDLAITGNGSLPTATATALADGVDVGGSVTIENNAP